MEGIRPLTIVIAESTQEGKVYLDSAVPDEQRTQTTHHRVFTKDEEFKIVRHDQFEHHVQGTKLKKAVVYKVTLSPEETHFLEGRFAGKAPNIELVS